MPYKGRAKFHRHLENFEVLVHPRINWWSLFVSLVWLGGLAFLASRIIITLLENSSIDWKPYGWLLFIGLIGVIFLHSVLWMMLGKEIISVKRGELKIRRQIFKIGFNQSYTISKIRELKINPTITPERWEKIMNHSRRINLIEFEYESSTIKFGSEFNLAEANLILEELKKNTSFNPSNFADDSGTWIDEEDEYVEESNFLKKLKLR